MMDWRMIWREGDVIRAIDQIALPFEIKVASINNESDAAKAISSMLIRGAPLVGVMGAYGLALALRDDPSDAACLKAFDRLLSTRPTAVNLAWALARVRDGILPFALSDRAGEAMRIADAITIEDKKINHAIGLHGLDLLQDIAKKKGRVNILTHCNAGWLATCGWGTATAPIYLAKDQGIDVHVWVDETRPRNQGGLLTAWELGQRGVSHHVIVDNAGGHLMQKGQVDIVLVGADRVTAGGDVCNKIGTYLKALAAKDCGVPFYACVPSPTFDMTIKDGLKEIEIEERKSDEVTHFGGARLVAENSPVANPGFDVTPARLVTGIITEKGIFAPGDLSSVELA